MTWKQHKEIKFSTLEKELNDLEKQKEKENARKKQIEQIALHILEKIMMRWNIAHDITITDDS